MYYSKQHKHTKSIKSVYNWSLAAGILLIISAIPLSFVLPVSVSFENSWLENLQVLALIAGSVYNFKWISKSADYQIADFHLWCAVLMIFMALRELGWGRVFYPYDFNDKGPVFIGMKDIPWKVEAYIVIALFIIFLTVFMFKKLPLSRMFKCRLPFVIIFFMLVGVVFSYCGDHGYIFGKLQGQIVEEFGELAFYVLIPSLCIHYHRELSKI